MTVSRQASPAALITGCSTGIGRATALRLHAAGFTVYETARQPESLAGLAAAGITTLRLDVTDEASMTAVVGRITDEHGGVAVLVNNAGFELAGPIEEVPTNEARALFSLRRWLPAPPSTPSSAPSSPSPADPAPRRNAGAAAATPGLGAPDANLAPETDRFLFCRDRVILAA